jgi:rhodanese-related sulfurtransferase
MKQSYKLFALAGVLVAAGAGAMVVNAQAPYRNPPAQQQGHDHAEIDPKFLIKAKQVHPLNESKKALLVDVRSKYEFDEEHIKNAISYPYQAISMASKFTFPKDKMLVMYCGCPHHLSGMSAEILRKNGYTNVRVIDEGYFGWKSQGFPVVAGKKEGAPKRRVSMDVSGKVMFAANQPAVHHDILLEHAKTGQLEATRTDAQGNFKMTLHFSGVEASDRLNFKLTNGVISTLSMRELKAQPQQQLVVPERLAAR